MKNLVTGGAGFIGSHLCDHLLAWGDQVHALDNLSRGRKEHVAHHLDNRLFRFIEADLLDLEGLLKLFETERYDAVFHLAANSDIQRSARETDLDLRQTFMTTYNVAECCRRTTVRELLFTSSSTVYGPHEKPLSETTGPLQPISLYGAAKLAAEAFLTAYASLYGISLWIFRLPNVVGSRLTHGCVHDFVERLRKDPTQLLVLGDGQQRKPYTHVNDVIDAMMLAWEHSHDRVNCFNIAGDGLMTVREIARLVVEEMGLPNVRIEFTGEERGWPGDVTHFQYNTHKIRQLGWKPRHSPADAIRETVRAMIQSSPPGEEPGIKEWS